MKDVWIVNRAGLINFWYYDDEVFEFIDGRLLIRGANGSGKSVTMQSFIPLLLDGNKSPERLDPFGSRARRLEDYLLGEEAVSRTNERTGYIYMEFKKQNTENYLTIGMGLRARRGQPVDFWGFTLLDGRRVGIDFYLYKSEIGQDGSKQKVPLNKRDLKNQVLPGGEVADSQREYMEMVNKYIFGFDAIDEYDELIKLLIQLRSPKLSKEFKPTVIYEIMNGALPALSDEDLRTLSETIENMDEIKIHLDELYLCYNAASKLKKEYDDYNRFILCEKTDAFLKTYNDLKTSKNNRAKLEQEIKLKQNNVEELSQKLNNLKAEQTALEQKEEQLRENNAFKAQKTLLDTQKDLNDNLQAYELKQKQLLEKETRLQDVRNQIKKITDEKELLEVDVAETLRDMEKIAKLIDFMEHDFSKDELSKAFGGKFDFTFWKSEVKKYRDKLKKALKALREAKEENIRYNKALKEQEDLKLERDRFEKDAGDWEKQFNLTKSEFVQKVHEWSYGNQELKLEKQDLEAISRLVLNYGESTGFDDILAEVRTCFDVKSQSLKNEQYRLENQRELLQTEYDQKKAELVEWENKKEPEPERTFQVEENRKRLADKNIPHIPFYKAVEFKKDIDEDIKDRIEAALENMGLMDALIIPPEYLPEALAMDKNMSDKYILPGAFGVKMNILQYFDIPELKDDGISRETVDSILRSILPYDEDGGTFVCEDGAFGIGIIKGKGPGNVKSKFIGYESRKRFRKEMLQTLSEELETIGDNLNELNSALKIVTGRLDTLKAEYAGMPKNDDLEEALKSYKLAVFELTNADKKLSDKNKEVSSLLESLQKLRAVARELTSGIVISGNVEAYEEAVEYIDDYEGALSRLEIDYNRMLSKINSIEIFEANLQDIEVDIENIIYEVHKIEERITIYKAQIQALQETIKSLGLEKLEEELKNCIERLKAIPQEIMEISNEKVVTAERIKDNIQNLGQLDDRISILEQIYYVYKDGLKDEWDLEFVGDVQSIGEYPAEEERLIRFCQNILRIIKPIVDRLKTDKEKISNRLRDAFHENHTALLNYGLSLGYLFDKTADEGRQFLEEDFRKLRRYQITANQQGKLVSLYTLYESIERDIAANEALLKETDRQLFEEIIMHNVGKKIRAKIFRAEEWVKKMNQLMSERDTSSGITFSLAWKPIPAENEQELDTRQLVDILKTGAQMLKPEDFDLVTKHFRSRVDKARNLVDESNNMETFHQIIKEVLDYRRWFEFKLYFRKEGENRRELTNHAFDRLSGGEKAMAMYIPLFSAVYARYEAAAKDAPKIISLDEAFAGVDDMNIRDMFKLMEDLQFNFIINSQVLWGDYDTVPGLAICELVRPKNANYVTVIRYVWDGQKRMLKYDFDASEKIAASRS